MKQLEPPAPTTPCHDTLTTQLYPSLLRQAAFLLAGHSASAIQPADLLHMAVQKLCRRPAAEIRNEPAAFSGLVRTIMQGTLVDEWCITAYNMGVCGRSTVPQTGLRSRVQSIHEISSFNTPGPLSLAAASYEPAAVGTALVIVIPKSAGLRLFQVLAVQWANTSRKGTEASIP